MSSTFDVCNQEEEVRSLKVSRDGRNVVSWYVSRCSIDRSNSFLRRVPNTNEDDDETQLDLEIDDLTSSSSSSSSDSEIEESEDTLPNLSKDDPYYAEMNRQKLWNYLFRNINHAVDELYCMCELESSIEQCEMAARVLTECQTDFQALADRLRLQSHAPENPKAMAWEVRKSSNSEKPTVVKALELAANNNLEPNWASDSEDEEDSGLHISTNVDDSGYDWSLSPGRRTLHEKLSSPERRKRSPSETKRLHEQRFFAAEKNRVKIDSARQDRFRLAAERSKDVNERNAQKLAMQEEMMWAKLGRADALHEAHLRWIVRKATSENTKVDEVGFIKSMTTEHRKASLQQRLDEVAERRERHLHQIRTRASTNFENVRAVTKRRDKRIESTIAEKHAAMLKRHEDVEARRQELQNDMKRKIVKIACKESNVSERRKDIKRGRRRGAKGLFLTTSSSYEPQMHDKADAARQNLILTSPGYTELGCYGEFRASDDTRRRYERLLARLEVDPESGGNPTASLSTQFAKVSTALRELIRFQETRSECDLHTFRRLGGIHRVAKWASCATAAVSFKVATEALRALRVSCEIAANRDYLLATNCLPELVDLLVWALTKFKNRELVQGALDAVTLPLRHSTCETYELVRRNVIPYIVNAGTMVYLADRFDQFRKGFSSGSDTHFLLKCVGFLEALTARASIRLQPVMTMADLRNPVVNVFKDTGLMGIVSLLISLVMEQRPQRRSESLVLTRKIMSISWMALKVLNNVARMDVELVQAALCSDSLQHEFIHMLSSFLSCCSREITANQTTIDDTEELLLTEVLILIGYYTLRNPANQERMRWGNAPNLLQQITNLPFQYFVDPIRQHVLFPTLASVCYQNTKNRAIMEHDLSSKMIQMYINRQREAQCAESSEWMMFAHRFPVFLWKDAIHFFNT